MASGGRKSNFLKDFGTERVSDSVCAKCPRAGFVKSGRNEQRKQNLP